MPSRPWTELAEAAGAPRFNAKGAIRVQADWASPAQKEALSGAFFWLTAFYFVYCARPGDLVPALSVVPLAKISGALAVLSLLMSIGKTQRQLSDLPKEAFYLFLLVILLFVSALFSPVWRGGAIETALDFSKVCIGWTMTFLLVTTLSRLRRIIFLQSASVAVVCCVALLKGRSVPRLADVIPGALYSNPNDMGFAIVLSIPFCLAFLLSARSFLRKAAWGLGIMAMLAALMLTASRSAFINLVITGTVLLWQFGVKGKRKYLIAFAAFLCITLLSVAGKDLGARFAGMFGRGNSSDQDTAYESYEQRRTVMVRSVEAVSRYPILGVGPGDFAIYSGIWREVHVSYLEIAAEVGIPALILYLLFFFRGFANLGALGRTQNLDDETVLFVGALKSSLVGFMVGACFAPEAYQFFPYFAVCYTSVLLAMTKEQQRSQVPAVKLPVLSVGYPASGY